MRRYLFATAAVALVMGWAVSASRADDNDNRTGSQKIMDKMKGDDSGQSNAEDAKAIRKVLAETVNAALTKGGFDDLTERLTKEDRDRLGKGVNDKDDALDARVAQFQKDWKEKYGHEFDIKEHWETVFNGQTARVYEGETNVRLLSEMPGSTTRPATQPKAAITETDRDIAAVVISRPGEKETREAIVQLKNEGHVMNAWRISIPNDLTLDQLRSNLRKHLDMANEAHWPADENEGYRFVAYHVLEAVANPQHKDMGKEMEKGTEKGGM